jgi:hypothetical protein
MLACHVVPKFVEIRIVEKQLGDHKISARLNFFPQANPIRHLSLLAGDVTFRETRRRQCTDRPGFG